MHQPKYRRPLNDQQIELLELLYKFRFGTNDLIANYFGKNHRMFVFNRLKVLEEQGLIGKRFDASYKLRGRAAAYYLLPNGARQLQDGRDVEINIKTIYKDKTVSESFIEQCLDIFAAYNRLTKQYGNKLEFFTKADLASYDYFPKPLPQGFLSLETKAGTKHFFLDILSDSQPFFAHLRRIKTYIDYCDSGEWEDTGTDFPAILFICESTSLQKKLQKRINRLNEDCAFATTTKAELYAINTNDTIWLSDDPDEKISLSLIS